MLSFLNLMEIISHPTLLKFEEPYLYKAQDKMEVLARCVQTMDHLPAGQTSHTFAGVLWMCISIHPCVCGSSIHLGAGHPSICVWVIHPSVCRSSIHLCAGHPSVCVHPSICVRVIHPSVCGSLSVGSISAGSLDLSFIKEAVRELLHSRRTLKASYGFGYYIRGNTARRMFENMQVQWIVPPPVPSPPPPPPPPPHHPSPPPSPPP